ncbi:MAG: PepSY-associated TM helix domain-containing protein [Terricaulis sp.]
MSNTGKSGGGGRGAFYRLCREWHGYISAFAFLALAFFSVTGITLNHPEWFQRQSDARETVAVRMTPDLLQRAAASSDQAAVLAAAVAQSAPVRGAFASGEVIDGEALLRFEGVTGNSDAVIDLTTGSGEVAVERADVVSIINDLHRGKNAGAVWKALIDIVGALVLALSLIGFVLFFSLRFRLRTSLALTAAGVALLAGLFIAFVP